MVLWPDAIVAKPIVQSATHVRVAVDKSKCMVCPNLRFDLQDDAHTGDADLPRKLYRSESETMGFEVER